MDKLPILGHFVNFPAKPWIRASSNSLLCHARDLDQGQPRHKARNLRMLRMTPAHVDDQQSVGANSIANAVDVMHILITQ